MNSQENNFNFTHFIKSMRENNVKYKLVISFFLLFFLLFILISPKLVDYIASLSPLKIDFMILNPFEIIFNYCKIAFFMALSIVLPIAIYQLSKLKFDFSDEEDRRTSLIYSLILYVIMFLAFFFTLKILLPLEIMLLYGFNFLKINNFCSLTAFFSLFFVNYTIAALCFSIPMMSKYSSNLPIFNYKDFEKYQSLAYYILGVITIILVLPFELIACGFVFLILCFFYRLAYKFAMRNRDE